MRTIKKYFYTQALFGVALLLTVGLSIAGDKALKKQQRKQAKRDRVDKQPLSKLQAKTTPDRYTQTEAHFQIPEMRRLIDKTYKASVTPHLNIVFEALTKERRYKDTHYVFYHGQALDFMVLQDLYKQLFCYENPNEKVPKDFTFMRFGDKFEGTAKEFVNQELREFGLMDDTTGRLAGILLSTNLSLFGSVGWGGESSWQCFVEPYKEKNPPTWMLENIFKLFDMNQTFISEIEALYPLLHDNPEQNILQVFVPQEKVDEIAYLAWILGVPAQAGFMDWMLANVKAKKVAKLRELATTFKNEQNNNQMFNELLKANEKGELSVQSFLKIYRNKPWELKHLNLTSVRLIFTPEILNNPDSGVKFFRYTTMPENRKKEYAEKLNVIVQKMIEEKKSRKGAKAPIPVKPEPEIVPASLNIFEPEESETETQPNMPQPKAGPKIKTQGGE